MHWTSAMCFSHGVIPVVSRIDALSNLRAAAFWTMHWLQSSWLLNTDVEKDRRTVHLIWNSWWHIVGCCRCSMHVLWPPKQSKWRTQVAFSPKMKGATETTRVWPFLHRFFAKICQEKKHNQIFYNNFIHGNTMEEGFEPAKEEAVRIFLEGGVPTSCWELRNRHLKTLWDRVSGVHEVHMGNNGQPLDCSLWMDYWVRFCEAFTSIRLWPGRTQTDPYLCQPFDCNNKMGGLLWEEGLGLLASPNCLISGKFRLVKLV